MDAVAFTTDVKHIVTGSSDGLVTLWCIKTGKTVRTFTGHAHWITSVSVSLDNKQMLSGYGDFTTTLWNLETTHRYACGGSCRWYNVGWWHEDALHND